MDEIVIECHGLVKKFDDLVAVNKLDMEIKKGEIYGLIGPNASGKTTTIKMLLGVIKPTGGDIIIFGEKVPSIKIRGRIGYMPQEPALYEDLTVYENINFFGGIYNMDKDVLEEKAHEVLKFVGLGDRRDSLVFNLSGGMKSRLSFACSLIHQPELLLLDEPTVGVDPPLRISFWDHFKKLTRMGVTMLITTHYMDEANRCDRVGMMWKGKLIAEDSPNNLKDKTGADSLEDVFLTLIDRGEVIHELEE